MWATNIVLSGTAVRNPLETGIGPKTVIIICDSFVK